MSRTSGADNEVKTVLDSGKASTLEIQNNPFVNTPRVATVVEGVFEPPCTCDAYFWAQVDDEVTLSIAKLNTEGEAGALTQLLNLGYTGRCVSHIAELCWSLRAEVSEGSIVACLVELLVAGVRIP